MQETIQLVDVSGDELAQLEQHEATIERGLKTFVEVGTALLAIRDGRLYRAQFGTFEEYCAVRWGITRKHGNKLIAAAEVVNNISANGVELHNSSSPIGVIPSTESQARPLTKLEPEEQPIVWQRAVDTAPNGKITAAHVQKTADEYNKQAEEYAADADGYDWVDPDVWQCEKCGRDNKLWDDECGGCYTPREEPETEPEPSHRLINQSTNNEWYTPAQYIEAARAVMGGIDLDPASCEYANRTVQATTIYTIDDNGLSRDWLGNVWMNPPYGYHEGNRSNQAVWTERLIAEYKSGNVEQAVCLVNAVPGNAWFAPLWEFPICFPDHRIRFYNEDTEAGQPTHSNALVYLGSNMAEFVREFSQFGVVARRVVPDEFC